MGETPWGIDRLNKERKLSPEQTEALGKECALYGQCFNTAAGKQVLELLKDKLEGQTWNPNMGPNYGYYNEGQNDVLKYIINRVKYSRRDK